MFRVRVNRMFERSDRLRCGPLLFVFPSASTPANGSSCRGIMSNNKECCVYHLPSNDENKRDHISLNDLLPSHAYKLTMIRVQAAWANTTCRIRCDPTCCTGHVNIDPCPQTSIAILHQRADMLLPAPFVFCANCMWWSFQVSRICWNGQCTERAVPCQVVASTANRQIG